MTTNERKRRRAWTRTACVGLLLVSTACGDEGSASLDTGAFADGGTIDKAQTGDSNVAVRKPASQSSNSGAAAASRAVDGNTNGTFSAGSVTHTNQEAAPWWRVDLGASHRVNGVTIFNRTDCCSSRLSNFHVDYLDKNGNVIAKKDYPGQAGTSADITLSAGGVFSVRVQLYGTNPLSLAEVQVWGAPDTAAGGVRFAHYALQPNVSVIPDFTALKPDAEGMVPTIDLSKYRGTDYFGMVFSGQMFIRDAGVYTFQTVSDDGSLLFIDGRKIVDNDGLHGALARQGDVTLSAGYHPFELRYFERGGGETLQLNYKAAGSTSFATVPASMLFLTAPQDPPADGCPNDPKTAPGVCGCATPDTDSDSDGTPDCKDACSQDRTKQDPGLCGCGVPEGSCTAPKVTLPVEVLGAEGTTEERAFQLSSAQAASAASLWLQVNNLSYENKASVQINSGSWLSLNHGTVTLQAKEKSYGGMAHGGMSTIRFTIPATGLRAGLNVVRFRFDRSDTISIGFRVVRMNVLNAAGSALLGSEVFVNDDPESWTGPFTDASSIAEGERLWRQANLWSHYLPNERQGFWYSQALPARRQIRAKCADCHTQDGRDLELFAYSNHSIIERSKFHGLTQREGELIASYIRSLSASHDDVGRPGRPWNPPFQPGPEVAQRPVWQWPAGAGLDAVLETDAEMVPDMFGTTPTKESVRAYFDSDKMWDTSTQRLSIQMPDWKRWLPMVHPIDAFDRNGWIDGTLQWHPLRAYQELRATLELRQPLGSWLLSSFRKFYQNYRFFFEQGSSTPRHWRTQGSDAETKGLHAGVPIELAKTSVARLLAVKFFELHHEFQLQDKAAQIINPVDQPRGRQWHGKHAHVFEVPPHFTSCKVDVNCITFIGQPENVGLYESSSWYQLQQVISPGAGVQSAPVDYNYMPGFILRLGVKSAIPTPVRYYYSTNVMYQTRTWSGGTTPNNGYGFNMRVMGPWIFGGANDSLNDQGAGYGALPRRLNELRPGLGTWVVEAQLRQFVDVVNRPENDLAGWYRQGTAGANDDFLLEPASLSNADMPNLSQPFAPAFYKYAQKIYWTLPKFAELGVDCAVLRDVVAWTKRAWPNVNWDATISRCQ